MGVVLCKEGWYIPAQYVYCIFPNNMLLYKKKRGGGADMYREDRSGSSPMGAQYVRKCLAANQHPPPPPLRQGEGARLLFFIKKKKLN